MPKVTCSCGATVEATRTSHNSFTIKDTGEVAHYCPEMRSEMEAKGSVEFGEFQCRRLMGFVHEKLHPVE